jgi:hypothetical protein
MSNPKSSESHPVTTGQAAKFTEARLRGAALDAADQKAAVDHADYEKSRNADAELHLDDEVDSLYSDGLDIGNDTEPLAGTDGNRPKGIKG